MSNVIIPLNVETDAIPSLAHEIDESQKAMQANGALVLVKSSVLEWGHHMVSFFFMSIMTEKHLELY